MTAASVPRIINALVNSGFTVTPGFKGNKPVSDESGCSSTLCLIVFHNDYQAKQHPREIGNALVTILEQLDVPYYGALIKNESVNWSTYSGRLPKSDPPLFVGGPYRSPGDISST